jgi:protein transport protein SEC24
MLSTVVKTISKCLDDLPGDDRTQVGFITYDSSVHFYHMKPSLGAPQMLVVADLEDMFVPVPDDLLVNLCESRDMVDALLESIPTSFASSRSVDLAMGPALKAAFEVIKHVGGKMLLFGSGLPSTGEGSFPSRETSKVYGTSEERTLLLPGPKMDFYRDMSIQCARAHVCVDVFLCPSQFVDAATLSCLAKITAGQLFFYPNFSEASHADKLERELTRTLTRETGFEAVMRVRLSRGLQVTNFFGNFCIRGQDLVALPTVTEDTCFNVEFSHAEDVALSTSQVCLQSALLYTSSAGERRIRVHTLSVPVTTVLADMFLNVDVGALCNVMAKLALEQALRVGLDEARTKVHQQCVEILAAARAAEGAVGSTGARPPETLELLPLYTMALIKNVLLRGGAEIRADERVYAMHHMTSMNASRSVDFLYPRFFALHTMPDAAGNVVPPSEDPSTLGLGGVVGQMRIGLPPPLNLTQERLSSHGIFLLHDGMSQFIWVGRAASPVLIQALFGTPSVEGVESSLLRLQRGSADPFARRVVALCDALREGLPVWPKLDIVGEGSQQSRPFLWRLVEDRADFNGGHSSYAEYLQHVQRAVTHGSVPM